MRRVGVAQGWMDGWTDSDVLERRATRLWRKGVSQVVLQDKYTEYTTVRRPPPSLLELHVLTSYSSSPFLQLRQPYASLMPLQHLPLSLPYRSEIWGLPPLRSPTSAESIPMSESMLTDVMRTPTLFEIRMMERGTMTLRKSERCLAKEVDLHIVGDDQVTSFERTPAKLEGLCVVELYDLVSRRTDDGTMGGSFTGLMDDGEVMG